MARFCLFFTFILLGFPDLIRCQSQDCSADKGVDGESGRPGRDGRSGQKGDHGDPGTPGHSQGLAASKGDAGDPGAPGEPGKIGYIGPEGPRGPPGDQGPKGAKGLVADTKAQHKAAFSAIQPRPGPDNRILFSQTITNEENVYDGSTGEFTCKEAGYYYFTFQVVSLGDLCLQLWMKKRQEGGKKLLTFCDQNVRIHPQVNSGGSVLNLDPGDRVWIETDAKRRNINPMEPSGHSSNFGGFLLFPRDE